MQNSLNVVFLFTCFLIQYILNIRQQKPDVKTLVSVYKDVNFATDILTRLKT